MTATAIRLARVQTRKELAAVLLMVLAYPGMALAALLPNAWAFAGFAAAGYAGDAYLCHRDTYLTKLLRRLGVGVDSRFLLRELLLLLLLARLGLPDETVVYPALACFVVFHGLGALHRTVIELIARRRTLPFASRNIDLSGLRVPDGPPRRLVDNAAGRLMHWDLFAVTGLLATAFTDTPAYGLAGCAATVLAALARTALLAPYTRPRRLPPRREKALAFVDEWLRDYRPTTVLYFSGSRESAYQVNMWLETVSQLEGRPLVVLRERFILPQLASTTVPVLCVPGAVHLMNLDLSSVRVALYPANVGKNIHLLRVPTMKHVFVGHGDSDKIASVNPYSKVYDEIWTAGRAGRDRYALADVGVRDEDIVEVGRPQLASIRTRRDLPDGHIPTVLYAPTWEGWSDEPGNTSVILAGENIVRRLVESDRPVRVLYKPHPFTGTRNRAAGAADRRIAALIATANAKRAADPRWAEETKRTAADRERAKAELTRIEARLRELGGAAKEFRDEAVASRDTQAAPEREAEVARLREEWNDAYWRSFGWWEHRVITGPEPRLYDCFNASDAMVSDISSVVSDFIASGKPYAVADSAGLGAEEFKRQNTAVRAAVILDNSAEGIGELLDAVEARGDDPLAEARRELKEYLLGPDEPTALQRFDAAVRALAAKAEVRNQGQLVGRGAETGANTGKVPS
ncbi:hypothetical protein V1L54_01700 [Streptomyces sp. TRM 70361]|uniref:hypothetical protein n=1 Tax=Streptomyces sp. TRM 70361 TaxID=3116553 RepID=UPI002E7C5655|nr:hypothetical protein [Streptomyces sp. TRM 70361]MEE1938143.1 hypothetical protein [Streptomyces sp. TRM 70361]